MRKAYGRTQALRGLNLKVGWGQTLTILGANGSGKTTLIKILATLTQPDSGDVRISGLSLRRNGKQVRRIIGVVTHEPLLYHGLTGGENLRFFARMFGLDRIDERINHTAEQMGIGARLNDKAAALSHGTMRRFSIARSLLHDPAVLIMDEPESGLDQEALGLLESIITDRAKRQRTTIMTTHNMERGIALGDSVAILSQGRIAYEGTANTANMDALRAQYLQHAGSFTGAPQ